ncbi:MAG: TonB-dependent receptor [Rhodocyclaceae bacterium]|nr:TonB-dependent receptor [Rhodocyclaceae bacterium]MCA3024956.1 TonB-dependent receptor [Rhodocyclaceae bacterium]MCA3031851.1 TonB-dependent receptor [Rhodocyclaceae bacterium]MCA3037423.1 TonB-dependent receptor [Rhodocyclaceae bacterium]MCA3046819.1 TonB-dependent receptor [Rhodocyclaceae bacterium]
MKQYPRKTLAVQVAIAIGAAGAMSGVTLAQAPAAPSAPKAAGIETITVTAQRRAENPQEVPVSVSAVGGDQLAERNITDLSQMESMSPGFTFGRSGTDARPAIRGVRTENVAINGDTTIGFFVDGIYKSRAQQALASFIDVDRVEIQRGPQGTLYGRNTFGGNISIVTNAPDLKKFEGSVSLLGGAFNRVRTEGVINIPLNEMWAVRFAGAVDRADGYVKNDFNSSADLFDQDLKFGRVALRFKPNAQFDAVLRVEATDQGGNGGSAFGYKQKGTYYDPASCQQLFNTTELRMNVRAGNRDGVNDCVRTVGAGAGAGANAVGSGVDLGIPLYRAGDGYRVDTDYQSFLKLKDTSASLDMSYRMDAFSLRSITGYTDFKAERTSDGDFSASTIAIDYQRTTAKTFTQELQLISEGKGPLGYVAGYYYFKDKLRGTFINQQLPRTVRSAAIAAPLSLPQNGAGFFDDPFAETESNAFYAQFSWKATNQLTLTLGGRTTEDKKDFRFANANAVLPRNAAGQPDGNLITLATPAPPTSAYGAAGTSNCNPVRGPGFYCDPANPSILLGGTYDQKTFKKSTGRFAADYKLSKQNLLYVAYSTGFRSGGFNSGQALEQVRTFLPEEVKAVEIGSKNRFFDNTLQINVAAFSNKYTNLQEQRQVPVGATTISTIFNAAKAKAEGVELEVEWRGIERLSVTAGLSLLDAKYTSFPDVALPFGTSILVTDASNVAGTTVNGVLIAPPGQRRVFAPGYSCGVLPGTGGAGQPAVAFGCDLTGKRVPYASRYQGSISAAYEFDTPNGGRVTPMVVANFNGGFYGQPTNAEIEKQGAYTKFDLKVNWEINRNFNALLYVDNVTDKETINRFVWGGGGALQVSSAPPRTFGLRLNYNFKSF